MNPYLKNLDAFADLLAACNVIDEAAVHDAVDYDGEVTLGNIAIAHRRLMAEETADSICESLKLERDEARERIKNNPWCEACLETDCCVSGDGTCAMIRKYLSEKSAEVKLTAVTKERDEARGQRDRLLEEREQWRLSSVCRELVEQRDRLAGALRIIADGTSCRECGGEDQARLAREAIQSLFCDALQSLTTNAGSDAP